MSLILISFLSALLYLVAAGLQLMTLTKGKQDNQSWVVKAGTAAVLLHTYSVYLILHTGVGIQLGFFPVSSLIAWLIAGLLLLSSLKKPLHNLFIALFPLAAITVILASIAPDTATAKPYEAGIISHILSSILAYSIFTIAAMQAILIVIQDRQLKQHHTKGIVSALPPLLIMEKLLFEMLWTAEVLLTVSLISGLIFIDDIFAQQLVHKTILSFIAWALYAVMLWGRHQKGWRGIAAIRWTLSGFGLLMLAYFGSKIALELIL